MSELLELLTRHCHSGVTDTPVPRLVLSSSPCPTELMGGFYYPLLCVLASGRKRLFLGDREFCYDPDHYLVASLELPVSGQVLEGPALGATLALEPAVLAALLLELPDTVGDGPLSAAIDTHALDGELRDALVRLVRLLDRPDEIPFMAPLVEREILFRLLQGPCGPMLRQMALPYGHLSQLNRAIGAIRERYAEKLRVEELADQAGMSATSFHRHFRAATAMSPLQYQKQIRLQEARRLLLARPDDVSQVGYEVGYESPSQFSREYRRLFGAPPGRDTAERRRLLTGS